MSAPAVERRTVLEREQDDLLVGPVALDHLGLLVGGQQTAVVAAQDRQEART